MGFFGGLGSAVEQLHFETHRLGERHLEAATLQLKRQASDPLQGVHSTLELLSRGAQDAASQGKGLLDQTRVGLSGSFHGIDERPRNPWPGQLLEDQMSGNITGTASGGGAFPSMAELRTSENWQGSNHSISLRSLFESDQVASLSSSPNMRKNGPQAILMPGTVGSQPSTPKGRFQGGVPMLPPARRRVVDNGECTPQEADKIHMWLSRVDHRGAKDPVM